MNRPTAAPAYFPYKHDSMAVVMAEEERQIQAAMLRLHARAGSDLRRYERERRSARG